MVILKTEKLFKEYNVEGNVTKVLNGIDLEINEGEFVSIMGPSGSGKSTLLYVLSGLEKPTSGSIFFKGEDLTLLNDDKLSKLRRREFGFIFQFYNLIPNLNVEENITLPLEFEGINRKEYNSNIDKILERVGLIEKKQNFPYQLSGGQQQRVAIARALIIDPKIIFADEPTGNLDSKAGEEILKLLYNLSKENNKTVLMVTHDNYAASFSDRIIKIKDGVIE
ncbi:ABC transporter related protein [Thermoanaerobacter mathranii subsp. mathranii str. A3]|jgi:putative ABC transport system ATP-binding protein|uniref:ABC transporter related protein n=3 Tax=Thermoanaerobacter TaxID=1754 RepID=D3T6Y4_THEIA|nr:MULTISPECIES: ABC transporter ATP-binding protein [Thermoanaerobacter]ADD01716.1 ABC transporter related protein [Thermoanaerobacter italicus Ab9]ADH60251.1 ABC transporter related protein [Thermoanaerobacter mathranii subsp. mathranii str. A3]MDP9749892.1 putative ABC transport system ATP-binding protein [Thermoanaerobacter pentosaceus]